MEYCVEAYAKKTFLALKNPYGTVDRVFPNVIDRLRKTWESHNGAWYAGYKATDVIPDSLKKRLEAFGFLEHTADRMALGGRAVDMRLVNPLTGNWMTGSSSGTALNVFYGINDLGVGTDGGGSVLAPAAALNLVGMISPLIEKEHLKQYEKRSTDGICFSPSIGLIARELETVKKAAGALIPAGSASDLKLEQVDEGIDIYGPRQELMDYLKEKVKPGQGLLSKEGPVDVLGMGDSVYGHFGGITAERQRMSGKGLLRVVNMCGKSAVTVPGKELGICTVLICESIPSDIAAALELAAGYAEERSELTERYFLNHAMYF